MSATSSKKSKASVEKKKQLVLPEEGVLNKFIGDMVAKLAAWDVLPVIPGHDGEAERLTRFEKLLESYLPELKRAEKAADEALLWSCIHIIGLMELCLRVICVSTTVERKAFAAKPSVKGTLIENSMESIR